MTEGETLLAATQTWPANDKVFYVIMVLFMTALIALLFSVEKN
jgi:hypothetical protein